MQVAYNNLILRHGAERAPRKSFTKAPADVACITTRPGLPLICLLLGVSGHESNSQASVRALGGSCHAPALAIHTSPRASLAGKACNIDPASALGIEVWPMLDSHRQVAGSR